MNDYAERRVMSIRTAGYSRDDQLIVEGIDGAHCGGIVNGVSVRWSTDSFGFVFESDDILELARRIEAARAGYVGARCGGWHCEERGTEPVSGVLLCRRCHEKWCARASAGPGSQLKLVVDGPREDA
jgi:hypothetical protein